MSDDELASIEAELANADPDGYCLACCGTGWAGGPYGGPTVQCAACLGRSVIDAAHPTIRKLAAEVRLLNKLLADKLAIDHPEIASARERAVAAERNRAVEYIRAQLEVLDAYSGTELAVFSGDEEAGARAMLRIMLSDPMMWWREVPDEQ